MDSEVSTAATPDSDTSELGQHPFAFSGNAREYFQIWIVNVLLTILTLGIYSAWAKVRTTRYFYGNTSVAGDSFEYHAKPLTILRGRAIAVAVLAIYVLASNFVPAVSIILFLLISFGAPWLIVQALRFRAAMSSWRNVRFSFLGDIGGAIGVYWFAPILGVVTLGLGMPYVWYSQTQYTVDNHRFGNTLFNMNASPGSFYVIALVVAAVGALILLALGIIFGTVMAMTGGAELLEEDPESLLVNLLVLIPIAMAYSAIYALYKGLRFRVVYNNLQLNDSFVRNRIGIGRFVWISLTNSIAILLTLGLAYPWAKVRMTAYLVNSMTLYATDLDRFVSDSTTEESATGDEIGEAFDLGLGI
ncbi:MAG: YjgN family protein [Pseudomonadota bacterium]